MNHLELDRFSLELAARAINASLGRNVRLFGKERAREMQTAVAAVMAATGIAKDRQMSRDMFLEIFKLCQDLQAIIQQSK